METSIFICSYNTPAMEAVIARRAARLASGHSSPVTPEPSDEEVTPPRAAAPRHREVGTAFMTIRAVDKGLQRFHNHGEGSYKVLLLNRVNLREHSFEAPPEHPQLLL